MTSENKGILSSISLVDLDFESQKNSLKNYLRSQDRFKDYDFEGASMTVLLDLLSVNTFKMAFYANMLNAESHLDSAQKRTSVMSNAKDLNYIPRSKQSAVAKVRVLFEATGESQPYTIPKGSQFSTLIKNGSYVFSTPESITCSSANTSFSFETHIYEGFYLRDSYTYQNATNQKFRISNKDVDTRSITVVVFENNAETGINFIQKRTLLDVNAKSKVFFLQNDSKGYYEIFFGDGVLGRTPRVGSTIVIEYRVSKGTQGNGAKLFSLDFDPTGTDEIVTLDDTVVLSPSQNGIDEEGTESIRFYAPRDFQTQERAVNPSDYEVLLKDEFPEINVVSAYGGEELTPPQMGKVFISIDLNDIDGLPTSKKEEYTRFIKRRNTFGIKPIFTSPEYMYLRIRSKVRYDSNLTTKTIDRLKTLVTKSITDYNIVELNNFNVTLRNSELETQIDDADISIISNITSIEMYKKVPVVPGFAKKHTIDFGVPIRSDFSGTAAVHRPALVHAMISSPFRYRSELVRLEDDGAGNIRIVKTGKVHTSVGNVGKIDYDAGIINLVPIRFDSFEGGSFKIYVKPADKDIRAVKNTILGIESSEIFIDIEEETSK